MSHAVAFQISLTGTYDKVVDKVTNALKAEGFGVLTSIDVQDTLRKKLNLDFRRYTILGACNPALAHQALTIEPLVGLLLPCNVTVEEIDHGVLVSIINPEIMLGVQPLADNVNILAIATEARTRLERVADYLAI